MTAARQAAPLPSRHRGESRAYEVPLDPEDTARRVDWLRALADPTRLEIVAILRRAGGPVCVGDLTASFELSQPTLSHHLARLRDAGLIEVRRQGVWSWYSLAARPDKAVDRLLEALLAR